MLTVHVRINDSSTNKPTPVRLRITDGDGVYHAPLGRLAHFRTGPGEDVGGSVLLDGRQFAYIDGTCEVRLPAGPITIDIAKGPEYVPVRRQVNLAAGQVSLRQTIERWTDERTTGWLSGDMRAVELPPHAALLEGAAEGLSIVQLLAEQRPPRDGLPATIPNLLSFSGTDAALRSPECLVSVNTLNTHPVLGSVALLNSHRPVFPLRFGAPGELDHWSVADWCDQCHRKKGLVVWPDLPRLSEDHPQGEALAALLLGKIDAFEVGPLESLEDEGLGLWYRLLDCGLRPVLVGGSGKDSNAVPLGAVRTYARLLPGQQESGESRSAGPASGAGQQESGESRSAGPASGAGQQESGESRSAGPASGAGQQESGESRSAGPASGAGHLEPSTWIEAVRNGRTFISSGPLLSLEVAEQGPGSVVGVSPGQSVVIRARARSASALAGVEVLAGGKVIATGSPTADLNTVSVETEYQVEGSAWIAARCVGVERLPGAACSFAHTNAVFLDAAGRSIRVAEQAMTPLLDALRRTLGWVETAAMCESDRQRQHLREVLISARQELFRRSAECGVQNAE